MKPLIKLTVAIFLLVFQGSLVAQTAAQKGWKAFLQNDRPAAKALFTEALADPSQKGEALLGLSMMADAVAERPFSYFKQFCAQEKDPAPYLYALWFSGLLNGADQKEQEEINAFLLQIAAGDKFDGTLKAMAWSRIGQYYSATKRFAEAAKAFSRIGAIEGWAVTGEFENISTSGFDKSYEPLKKPGSDAEFINKAGAKVKWFVPPYTRKDKWFDLTYYFDYKNSVVFAQSFVKSPGQQTVQLRAGVSGSMKVWLNDQLIIAEPEERNNDLDSYIRTVQLNEGYNRILVQVGESYAGRSNFLVRITGKDGNPVPGLTSGPAVQAYKKDASFKTEKVETAYEQFFKDKIKAAPENPVNYIFLSRICLQNDGVFEARQIVEDLKRSWPNSTFVNGLMLELYSRSDNRTGLESTREAIKMADPEHPLALNMLYNYAVEREDYTKAGEYTDKLEAIFGKDAEQVLLKRINLAGKNKNQAEMIRLAEYAYNKYPLNRSFVEYKYLIENSLRKNSKAAVAVLKEYLKVVDDYGFSRALASIYFDTGKIDDGIKVYLTEIENDPVAVGIYTTLAKIYAQLQNYPKAEEWMRKALALAPYAASYHADLAALLNTQGKKEQAIAEYHQTLEYNPNSYGAIKELRKLENKKDVFEYFKSPDVQEIVRKAPPVSEYPDDNVLILSENTQVVIYPGGGSEERHRMLAKILNSAGLESWKEYAAGVKNWQTYIIENAEVIKAGGSKVPAEVKETQIVFTNLEVGDCIYIQYKLYNYSQGQLANKFWDTFYFSHGYPYLQTEYSVLAAKDQKLFYKFSQKDIQPQVTEADEFVLYTWKNEDEPGMKYEDKMPAMDDVANMLNVSTIPDWAFISNWYNDLASAKARPAYEVKAAVNAIFDGTEDLSETEKAERIYDYITRNITYSSVSFRQSGLIPQNPSAVLNTRIGDCKDVSTLFLSMAKEAGLNAGLVLVNTKDAGVKGTVLPSINFNHCIVKVNTDGKERYLELTSNYLPFSSLSWAELNSAILDIDGSADAKAIKYLNPQTRKQNSIRRSTVVSVEGDDLVVSEQNCRVAAPAAYLREAYLNLSAREREKRMQEALGRSYQGAQLTRLRFTNLENSGTRDTLFTDIEYRIKEDVKKIGGMSIISLPWSNKALASDFTLSGTRYFPLDLSQLYDCDSETEEITLTLPAGKKLIEGISPLKLSNEFMDYVLDVKQSGGTIICSRTLKLKKESVPADQVAEFHDFYKKIISADSRQIALR